MAKRDAGRSQTRKIMEVIGVDSLHVETAGRDGDTS
jgi:hypothetical protein